MSKGCAALPSGPNSRFCFSEPQSSHLLIRVVPPAMNRLRPPGLCSGYRAPGGLRRTRTHVPRGSPSGDESRVFTRVHALWLLRSGWLSSLYTGSPSGDESRVFSRVHARADAAQTSRGPSSGGESRVFSRVRAPGTMLCAALPAFVMGCVLQVANPPYTTATAVPPAR